jgi:hypothetical protein
MELFLPSLLIFILAALMIFLVLPRMSPLILVIMSLILVFIGTWHHFKIFANEYRQSTWQESLKIFAPGIIIVMIFVYLFFAFASFQMGKKATVESIPNPPANTATNPLTAALNKGIDAVNNATSSAAKTMNNVAASIANTANKKNNEGPTRSFLATL